jgi:hypothetical protein
MMRSSEWAQLTDMGIDQQKLYHCPQPSCRREYVSLAAIINHLESEMCGYMKFERVQQDFGTIIDPMQRLAFN